MRSSNKKLGNKKIECDNENVKKMKYLSCIKFKLLLIWI